MKWLIRILFFVIAAFGLVIGALLLMPKDKLSAILTEQVKAQTGRDLTISGDVGITFWPILGISAGAVTFSNAPWAGPQPMLSAESLDIGLDAAALINGQLRIKRVFADNPVLRLELSDGRGNWELNTPAVSSAESTGSSSGGGSPSANPSAVTLDQLELTNARLVYVDNGVVQMDFSGVDLSASWPDVTAPMAMSASMAAPGGSVDVNLTIPDLPAFSSGVVTPLTIALKAPGGEISFDGRVNLAGEMDGETQVVSRNTKRMLAAFGQKGVSIPNGLGRKAEISAHMTYTRDGRIALRDMVAVLDNNQMTGEADIEISSPPKVTAQINSGDLDLTKALASESTGSSGRNGGGGASASTGWSRAPIDASALALANGSVRLKANSIAVPDLTLGPSDLRLNLSNSRAVLKMQPATLFSGTLNGQVVANNRNGLSVGGDLTATGINLQEALSALGGIERLSGTASGRLKFLGVGQNENQIMRSLSGEGNINVGSGVISGFDLDRLMGRGEGTGGTTVFNSLTASFTMKNGNLRNDDLLMQLDNFRADGSGRVGLAQRDIDYLFTPVALRANSGKGISVPVRIEGPWESPSIKPDLTKVIEAAAEAELKDLENDAKNQVLKKVGKELDTEVTDTDQIGDALKNKLEDEAKKGLLKLFGGD
ncbi:MULTISPECIES: AsmA family protein [unclassified Ruegeria]|uniref:AsmA family protein n=1 Tax=unclassified Ruegeria TaxID=2625375 RepID=UPI001488F448|nr:MULTISPECIES: AsmA family protein [unclassified Ruegeria]